jgi:hypothetical protein
MSEEKHPCLPLAGQLKKAIGIYLRLAYPGGPAPDFVTARVKPVLAAAQDQPSDPAWFETARKQERAVYRLRLGQKDYPHMKLSIEEAPDGSCYLYFADAHDSHLYAPEGSPDAQGLALVRKSNAQLVTQIETAWTQENLPTFRGYLRQSLAKKQG